MPPVLVAHDRHTWAHCIPGFLVPGAGLVVLMAVMLVAVVLVAVVLVALVLVAVVLVAVVFVAVMSLAVMSLAVVPVAVVPLAVMLEAVVPCNWGHCKVHAVSGTHVLVPVLVQRCVLAAGVCLLVPPVVHPHVFGLKFVSVP